MPLLLILFLIFLPVNLSKHFFFDFVYVEGVLVDYLIPTVYLTDILIWGLLGFWVFRTFQKPPSIFGNRNGNQKGTESLAVRTAKLCFLSFVLVSGLSVFHALNQPTAVYRLLKLVEYVLFSFYVSKNVDLKKDWPTIVKLLSIGVIFESTLAIAQWLNQGSLLGFWFFGENSYTVSTPGIATLDFGGVKKVRPYGTFPHPNVLGGYLAIILPWVFYEGIKGVKGVIGIIALYLSFSRSAWIVGALGLLPVVGLGLRKGFTSFLLAPFSSLLNTFSVIRRAELNWIALEVIKNHPLFGVGLNNFTVRMDEYGRVSGWSRFLQPVHNIYLLVAAEIGLLGLLVLLGLLFSAFYLLFKSRNYLLLMSLTQIVLLGLTDHYLWTIQQGSLLFWLILGLAFSPSSIKRSRIGDAWIKAREAV